METVPNNMENIGCVMSNFDYEIETDAEDKLKSGQFFGGYSAWDLHGTVWFNTGKFKCRIMQYHSHIDTIEAESLSEIMSIASEKYGSG
ncbi:MAG TPA: hypothetical protein ENI07_17515 [Desulfobacterales bacterium]|nr:hypothetical protein [Desulfobacterales bacterium]